MMNEKALTTDFKTLRPALPKGAAAKARNESLNAFFAAGGLPHPKMEDWRYADFPRLSKARLAPNVEAKAARPPRIAKHSGWPLAVLSEGLLAAPEAALSGVRLAAASDALAKGGALAGALLRPVVEDNPFDQLNRSFAKDGFVLDVPEGGKAENLELVLHSVGLTGETRYVRNLVRLGPGAKAALLLRTVSEDEAGWLNLVTGLALAEGAELVLYADFEAAGEALVSSLMEAALAEGARLTCVLLAGGLPSLRHETHLALAGAGAEAILCGGLLAGANETVDVLTRITHAAPGAKSRQLFKGVASAKGRSAFQGRIVVEQGADKTEARQTCNNLLLEAGGEANVKPELLIFADDVVCAHGATVGEIEEDALFYLMQRGTPESEARRILVQAFLGGVLDEIADDSVRAAFGEKVNRWMTRHTAGGQP